MRKEMWLLLALLCLSLPLAAPEVVVLNGGTFDSVIADGFWFIDFYAPWCGYCKILAPIWEETSKRFKEVHFAKMDCTIPENKPICHRYGVHSYPTLKFYHKGTYLQDYSGHRTMESFIAYSEQFIRELAPPPTPEVPQEQPAQETEPPAVEEIAQKEVQEEAQQQQQQQKGQAEGAPRRVPRQQQEKKTYISSKEGKVVTLTDENFEKETKEGPWFIKFYAPWCGHCKKLAPTWDELAFALKGKINVGKIDCDAESVCDKYGVRSYPTLKFFLDGYQHDYRDKRSLDTLINFATRMSGQPLVEINLDEYNTLRKEKDLFFLYLHPEGANRQMFEELSKKFMSISNFFTSSDPALLSSLGVKDSAFLVSQNAELSFFKENLASKSILEKWVGEHKYPLFAELDSSNAGEILESEDIVVMLVADPDKPEFRQAAKPEMIKAAVQHSREIKQGIPRSPVHFVWLNGALWESYVSKNYEIPRNEYPAVVVLRPSLNLYFDTRANGDKVKVEAKDVLSLVWEVDKGKVQGKSIGGFIRGVFAGLQRQAKPLLNWISENVFVVIGGVVLFTIGLTWLLVSSSPSEKMEKAE